MGALCRLSTGGEASGGKQGGLILAIRAALDKSSVRPRGWGEPRFWDLTFSWFLTLPLLILGHSSWMLSPCPLFHELPTPPQCSPCRLWKGEVQGEPFGRCPPAQSSWHTPTKTLCPLGSASIWECLRDLYSSQVSLILSSQGVPSTWHHNLPVCAGSQREGSLAPVPPLIPSLLLSAVGFIIRICTVYCV